MFMDHPPAWRLTGRRTLAGGGGRKADPRVAAIARSGPPWPPRAGNSGAAWADDLGAASGEGRRRRLLAPPTDPVAQERGQLAGGRRRARSILVRLPLRNAQEGDDVLVKNTRGASASAKSGNAAVSPGEALFRVTRTWPLWWPRQALGRRLSLLRRFGVGARPVGLAAQGRRLLLPARKACAQRVARLQPRVPAWRRPLHRGATRGTVWPPREP